MNGTLVDTNIIIDVFDPDCEWHRWSSDALLLAAARGPLVINPIVYSELSGPFDDPIDLDVALLGSFERHDLPWPAAFLAGKAFREYGKRGGQARSPLPDFYIGAHAAVAGLDVLTRDPRRFTSYFRGITVISPDDSSGD